MDNLNQQPTQQPTYAMVQPKNIALCIILSLITCGIYALYWIYTANEDMKVISNTPGDTSGGMVILLSIVTCGIYEWFWLYKQGQKVDNAKVARGQASGNSAILYLILSIFGLSIVTMAIMQNEINELSKN